MNPAMDKNIGAYLTAHPAGGGRGVAAGTGDNSEVDGPYVDRQGCNSATLVISGRAVLTEDKTLSITANIQDSDDGDGAGDDFGPAFAKTVVATGGAGGSTEDFCVKLDFDLSAARRYVRAQVTPDADAGSADLFHWGATWIFGPGLGTPNQATSQQHT